jgi:hypothetical protein
MFCTLYQHDIMIWNTNMVNARAHAYLSPEFIIWMALTLNVCWYGTAVAHGVLTCRQLYYCVLWRAVRLITKHCEQDNKQHNV